MSDTSPESLPDADLKRALDDAPWVIKDEHVPLATRDMARAERLLKVVEAARNVANQPLGGNEARQKLREVIAEFDKEQK